MPDYGQTSTAIFVADLLIRVLLSVRVVMRREPVGVSLAWLVLILLIPFVGAALYLLIGELRLGTRRAKWAATIHGPYEKWLAGVRARSEVDWARLSGECASLAALIENAVGLPATSGNELTLFQTAESTFRVLVADIDAAQRTCHLEFYIWNPGGLADEVAEALRRARARGVTCRVLVDAVGSRSFLHSEAARDLRRAGVRLEAALRGGIFRSLLVRFDLRLHRKIAVIDGEIAYTGSSNLVDPRYFKQEAGVGQWVDAMVRLRGPVVEELAVIFIEDWEIETGKGLQRLSATADVHPLPSQGCSVVQAIPSGPLVQTKAIREILLTAIYAARRELVLTTPYFVPDEMLLTALRSAADRGVEVTIIIPKKVDSRLVRLASQAYQGDLAIAGARILLFHDGLLHTKSITVDGQFSFFGSLNLDPRSLHLNFEITLAIYDREFTSRLRELQQSYIDRSQPMDLTAWQSRSGLVRFVENSARLVGPLL